MKSWALLSSNLPSVIDRSNITDKIDRSMTRVSRGLYSVFMCQNYGKNNIFLLRFTEKLKRRKSMYSKYLSDLERAREKQVVDKW